MQIWSAPELRGRVMAIYMLLTLGTTVAGGPFIGWVCQHWTPRTGLGVAGIATLTAATLLALPLRARLRDEALVISRSAQPESIWEPLDASG
jgi:MFS family permease